MENSLCHISMLVEYGEKIHKKLATIARLPKTDRTLIADPQDSQTLLIELSAVLN